MEQDLGDKHLDIDSYFTEHPCAVLKVSSERKVVFGREEKCLICALDEVKQVPYYTYAATGVAMLPTQKAEEYYITCFLFRDANGVEGCYKTIHEVPISLQRVRSLTLVGNEIRSATTVAGVIQCFTNYLTSNQRLMPYRIRWYEIDDPKNPNRKICCWHDNHIELRRPYIDNLVGISLDRMGPEDAASFYSVDHFCMVLVTPNEEDVRFFMENYHSSQETPNIWAARSDIFEGLRLYKLTKADRVIHLFKDDEEQHCWLDVPFGFPGNVVGKVSITPQGHHGRFSRGEMEEISSLMALCNAQIANIEARAIERREILLGTIHEVAQPAFMALTSIEFLRRKDKENNITPETDTLRFYVKKNIEMAIRMVAFLNDAPRVRRDLPSFSPIPTKMIAGAVAPVVNMLRHEEFSRELNKRRVKIIPEHLSDLEIEVVQTPSERKHVKFKFETTYDIYYDGLLDTVVLYVDQYRLQEIFYNLFSNASKYRHPGEPFETEISLKRDLDFQEPERSLYAHFYVIDVNDYGMGIEPHEARRIFGPGEQGSASIRKFGYYGTGKGLFVIREIMLSIGGEVYVANYKKPTTLRLFFPAACKYVDWVKKLSETRKLTEAVREHLAGKVPEF